jgi:hypothetical protein
LAALVRIPKPSFPCNDSTQLCSTDKPLGADSEECKSATRQYEKTLAGLLTPRWWSVPASALEACRVRGKQGPLSKEQSESLAEGSGEEVQGTERVRMLVTEDACSVAGMTNEFLVVRTAKGISLTPLYYDFNQSGQEAPFSLGVARDKLGIFALFTTEGHDMRSIYSATTAYKIDPQTGYAAEYPLFVSARGGSTRVDQSQPVVGDLTLTDNAILRDGKFVRRFNNYTDNLCSQDDSNCRPVTAEPYTWNGKAFMISDYEARHKDFVHKLAAQRDCVKRKFDPNKGAAPGCRVYSECDNYNDLTWLNLKAGKFTDARNNAEMALNYCVGYPGEYEAARYNYRQSQLKLGAK